MNRPGSAREEHLLIRLTKRAFQEAGISLPDEAREIVFPRGLPVRMLPEERRRHRAQAARRGARATGACGRRRPQRRGGDFGRQPSHSRAPEGVENLLET